MTESTETPEILTLDAGIARLKTCPKGSEVVIGLPAIGDGRDFPYIERAMSDFGFYVNVLLLKLDKENNRSLYKVTRTN